jgi:hypothetical protein
VQSKLRFFHLYIYLFYKENSVNLFHFMHNALQTQMAFI